MKTLLLYYSYGGNTHRVAQHMKEMLECDTAEIQTVTAYTGSYDSVVNQGQQEVNAGFEPPIRPIERDLRNYDVVILGTPVWWYTFAPAVKTALSAQDWNGKIIYPFATNGGWIGHTFQDIEKACAGATVKKGLNILFEGNQMQIPMTVIDRWLKQIKEA